MQNEVPVDIAKVFRIFYTLGSMYVHYELKSPDVFSLEYMFDRSCRSKFSFHFSRCCCLMMTVH